MRKLVYSIAMLTSVLLTVSGFRQSVQAQTSARNLRVQQLYSELQAAVCRNDWEQALEVIQPLIGSSGISSSYRGELIRFRHQLEDFRAARSEFAASSSCEAIAIDQPVQIPLQYPHRQLNFGIQGRIIRRDLTVEGLHATLQNAVCNNDWEQAIRATQSLIGSPNITPSYRQQLVVLRHQLEEWRATHASFAEVPGCNNELDFRQ